MSETVTVSYKHYMELSALEGKINLLKDALEKTDQLMMESIPIQKDTFTRVIDQHEINEDLLRSDDSW